MSGQLPQQPKVPVSLPRVSKQISNGGRKDLARLPHLPIFVRYSGIPFHPLIPKSLWSQLRPSPTEVTDNFFKDSTAPSAESQLPSVSLFRYLKLHLFTGEPLKNAPPLPPMESDSTTCTFLPRGKSGGWASGSPLPCPPMPTSNADSLWLKAPLTPSKVFPLLARVSPHMYVIVSLPPSSPQSSCTDRISSPPS